MTDYRQAITWPSDLFPVEHDLNQQTIPPRRTWTGCPSGTSTVSASTTAIMSRCRPGMIAPKGVTMIVINAFDEGCECMPIGLTPDAARALQGALRRALESYTATEEKRRSAQRETESTVLDRAVLDAKEWQTVTDALRGDDEDLRAPGTSSRPAHPRPG